MEREAFLNRIRQATAAGRAYQVALNPAATADQSYVGGGVEPIETFLKEWRAVGGFGKRAASAQEALAYLAEIIDKFQIHSVLTWEHPVLSKLGIEPWLKSRGIDVQNWSQLEQEHPTPRKSRTFSAGLGITSVDWAVAETGSLAVCARPGGRGRSVSLLPPVHIALLTPDQIVPDLFDLYQKLEQERQRSDLPSNVTLITGPSKTGDIQLKLTTGVHGPGEVHALVVENAEFSKVGGGL